MNVRSTRWLAALIAVLVVAGPAVAEDARPQSDEKCIERCDIESDKCMAASNGDPDKVQACDDKYSECLQACDAHG
ncbi:MAG: hypothetical protein HW417_687 [Steroidobacteraceae bacterium]|nr:hypothetical protein [Steroidobacteraceae bacterium]MBM2853759.1 hypothetical protein [Steroidobacteraceae bacterium]